MGDMAETKGSKFTAGKRKASQPPGTRDGSRAPSKKMRLDAAAEKRSRSKSVPRNEIGVPDPKKRMELAYRAKKQFKKTQVSGKPTESNRHVFDLKPKHLFSGKRGLGT